LTLLTAAALAIGVILLLLATAALTALLAALALTAAALAIGVILLLATAALTALLAALALTALLLTSLSALAVLIHSTLTLLILILICHGFRSYAPRLGNVAEELAFHEWPPQVILRSSGREQGFGGSPSVRNVPSQSPPRASGQSPFWRA
jgi:hypothetical protein